MVRRIFLPLLAIAVLLGCGNHKKQYEHRKAMREGFPPEILAYHADGVIRPGATWRIYLRLKDLDCDMTYIVADLWQSGVGVHPPSYTPIKATGCGEVKGFLWKSSPQPPEQWKAAASNPIGTIQIDLVSSQSLQGRGG